MSTVFERIWAHKWLFLSTFFIVFTISYIVLLAIDFIPETPTEETEQVVEIAVPDEESVSVPTPDQTLEDVSVSNQANEQDLAIGFDTATAFPTEISIKRLDRVIPVFNPQSRIIADLDAALLNGAVRHPDSATLAQDGNVFILAHSSYLPNVFNKNFQAFNGIQNLEWGDLIELRSLDAVYEYRVEKVYRANAQDTTVPIAGTGQMLTLATCNSFGTIDDRYIVEAKRVGVEAL